MNNENFQRNYDMLNDEQKQAVESLYGPAMVIAGPGTGKTQIIGMRAANIILKTGILPQNILITTFTEAGVIAIKKRLVSLIGPDAHKIYVSTVHSFAEDVIKSFPEKFTEEKLGVLIDEIEGLEILSSIMQELISEQTLKYLTTTGDLLFYLRTISSQINNLKREGVSPQKFEKHIREEDTRLKNWLEEKRNNKRIKKIEKYEEEYEKQIGKLRELQLIYTEYNSQLRKRELYDFNDMINFALERFRQDISLRQYYAESYQFIMLDEYQDTNNPQNEIIDLILSEGDDKNIMVVGDDDQSIYRFQGANIENMLDFTANYPETNIIVLEKNYRSQQGVLDSASSLISENTERLIHKIPNIKKNLVSQTGDTQTPVNLYMSQDDIREKISLLDIVQNYILQGSQPSDIAIIVRGNKEVEEYSNLLLSKDIPVSSKRKANILENDLVILLIKYLKILDDVHENESDLMDILRSLFAGSIDSHDVFTISRYAYQKNYARKGWQKLKLFDLLLDYKDLELKNPEALENFCDIFLSLKKDFAEKNILLAMSELFEKLNIFELIQTHGNFHDTQSIYTLYHTIRNWSQRKKNLNLTAILEKIDLYQHYGYHITRIIDESSQNGVQILTAHASKGLEYKHVIIPGLAAGNWEGKAMRSLLTLPEGIAGNGLQFSELESMSESEKKQYNSERQLQEDRRLFFVALSRAKQTLDLTFAASKQGKLQILSPLIDEVGELSRIQTDYSEQRQAEEIQREVSMINSYIPFQGTQLDFIMQFMENYRLSASDLNTFLVNPIDFLTRTVFRYPFKENENTIFGTIYHRTLELFYKKYLDEGKIKDEGYLISVFDHQLDTYALTQEERERLTLRGHDGLRGYYQEYKNLIIPPLKTEYRFSRKNIMFEDIPITGVIDKIDLLSEDYNSNTGVGGSLFQQQVRVTDYKTGGIKYTGDILGVDREGNPLDNYEKGRFGRQLMFYKLLMENDFEMSSQYSIGSFEIDFCEGKKGKYKRQEVVFSDEQYQDFQRLVKETYGKMKSREFWSEILGLK